MAHLATGTGFAGTVLLHQVMTRRGKGKAVGLEVTAAPISDGGSGSHSA
jgi:hypothetical protein